LGESQLPGGLPAEGRGQSKQKLQLLTPANGYIQVLTTVATAHPEMLYLQKIDALQHSGIGIQLRLRQLQTIEINAHLTHLAAPRRHAVLASVQLGQPTCSRAAENDAFLADRAAPRIAGHLAVDRCKDWCKHLLPHRVPKTDYGLIGNQTIYVYSFLLANISEREIKTS